MSKKSPRQEVINMSRKRYLLAFLILIGMGVAMWIIVTIFSSQKTTTIPSEIEKEVLPFNPELNLQVLDQLTQKPFYSETDLANFPIYIIKVDRFTRTQSVVPLEE